MCDALIKDIKSLTKALNEGELNGEIYIKIKKGKRGEAIHEGNNNDIIEFAHKASGGVFVKALKNNTSRGNDAFILYHPESGKFLRILSYSGRGRNDILSSKTAIYGSVFADFPQGRENQIRFYRKNIGKGAFVDNASYIILIHLEKDIGERFSISHPFDYNLTFNVAGKVQTDYSLAEKRMSPQEFHDTFFTLEKESIQMDLSVHEVHGLYSDSIEQTELF